MEGSVGHQEIKTSEQQMEAGRHVILFWKNYPTFRRQIFACFTCMLGSVGSGMTFGFTGTLLPEIDTYVEKEMRSWIAGINVISTPVGILFGSLVMNIFGRKASLMYSNVPWLFGWLYLSFSADFWSFFVGSAFVGFSSGFHSNSNVVYLAEMPEPRLRGLISTFNNLSFSFGILFVHLVTVVIPWRLALKVSALIPVLAFITACFIPEIPNWLILKENPRKAEKNFFWLRGNTAQSQMEFDELLSRRSDEVTERKLSTILENILSEKFFKSCLLSVLLFSTLIGSGMDLCVYYAVDMFKKLSSKIDARTCTILIDVIRLISGLLSCYFIKKVRRKSLFYLSACGTIFTLIWLVLVLIYDLPPTVLVLTFCCYILIVQIGLVPLAWLITGEIFPQVTRDLGTGFALTYYYFLTFILVKTAPDMIDEVGMPVMLSVFAVIVIIGSATTYFILPETKKCTLQQVEDMI